MIVDKNYILDKLKQFLNIKTDTEFANYIGVNINTFKNWRHRGYIDYEIIKNKIPEINMNWIITGKGNMLIKEKQNQHYILESEISKFVNENFEQLMSNDKSFKDIIDRKVLNLSLDLLSKKINDNS